MLKKLCGLCLTVLIPGMVFAAAQPPFPDVAQGYDYAEAIGYLYDNGIVSGYPDGTFKPESEINRAEFLKILVGAYNQEYCTTNCVEDYSNCFTDVHAEWFAPYVCQAKELNWVSGYPDGSFKPAQTINKVEAIKMVLNSQGIGPIPPNVTEQPFDDVPVDAWYAGYVTKAKEVNVLEERGSILDPGALMTRGALSQLLYNTILYKGAHGDENVYGVLGDTQGEEAFVTRVIDGDTIEVELDGETEKVRLLGIDAPEVSSNDCYASEATEYLNAMIFDDLDTEVTLYADPLNDNRDKYGRLLRYVSADFGDAGLALLEGGYVLYYDTYDVMLGEQYAAAEQRAITQVKGLWHDCQGAEDEPFDSPTDSSGDAGVTIHAVAGTVVIADVFYDGVVPMVESDEYVELKNNGSEDVDLKGYRISGSKGDETFVFPSYVLGTGESVKVYTNQGDLNFGSDQAIWNNSGETVYLYSADGALADELGW